MEIKGLRKVAGMTKRLTGNDNSVQVFYNTQTHEAWGVEHVGASWTTYDAPEVIGCGHIRKPATMQEIEEMVADACSQTRK